MFIRCREEKLLIPAYTVIERVIMKNKYAVIPAFKCKPGTKAEEDGICFTTAIRRGSVPGKPDQKEECGVLLYSKRTSTAVRIPFTEECFLGSLCSAKVPGLSGKDWYYNYYLGEKRYTDPYATAILPIKKKYKIRGQNQKMPEGAAAMGAFFDENELIQGAEAMRPLPKKAGQDRLFYCLHVRGFTRDKSAQVQKRGTFAGVSEQIPHLQRLGVTTVILMPVYELAEVRHRGENPVNFWGFGEGYYFAPKKSYAGSGEDPRMAFADMVRSLHRAGIEVVLQMHFTGSIPSSMMQDAARYYVRYYGIDGFYLIGNGLPLRELACDPALGDTLLYSSAFDDAFCQQIRQQEMTSPFYLQQTDHLVQIEEGYRSLLRRFAKGDDFTLEPFLRSFLQPAGGRKSLHFVTNYDGFTLADLVSYSHKHNEDNGEENKDGTDQNDSWNCGLEGRTRKGEIRKLRMCQMKNMLLLLLLSRGYPLLRAGDECLNSQNGNNNPYCQDNELGWVRWNNNADARMLQEYLEDLSVFRREHPVFSTDRAFRYTDYLSCGYPDVSLHGQEPWKPELSAYSHTAGILLCENYAKGSFTKGEEISLLYIAVNMHWKPQSLGLPNLPHDRKWALAADTSLSRSFLQEPQLLEDQKAVQTAARSIKLLTIVPAAPAKEKESTGEKEEGNTRQNTVTNKNNNNMSI